MNILLLGGSGLVGSEILSRAVLSPSISKIFCIVRNKTSISIRSEKIILTEIDFDLLESKIAETVPLNTIQAAICSFGTTIKKAGSREEFKKIDFNYSLNFAKACKHIGTPQFVLISSVGAHPNSSNFYLNVKGNLEREIEALNFKSTHIFRPGLLIGKRKEHRLVEGLAQNLAPLINSFLIGPLKKYQSVKADNLAKEVLLKILPHH